MLCYNFYIPLLGSIVFSFPELTVTESLDFISAAPLPFGSKPREITCTSLLGHEVGD